MNNPSIRTRANRIATTTHLIVLTVLFGSLSPTIQAQGRQVIWEQDFEDPDQFWTNWHQEGEVWEVIDAEEIDPSSQQNQILATTRIGGGRFVRHAVFLVPNASEYPTLKFDEYFDFEFDADFGSEITGFTIDMAHTSYGFDSVSNLSIVKPPFGPRSIPFVLLPNRVNGDGITSRYLSVLTPNFAVGGSISFDFGLTDLHEGNSNVRFDHYLINNGNLPNATFQVTPVDGATTVLTLHDSVPPHAYSLFLSESRVDISFARQTTASGRFTITNVPWGRTYNSIEIREPGGQWKSVYNNTLRQSGTWTEKSVDLTEFAGRFVELAFSIPPTIPQNSKGWFIGNLRLAVGKPEFKNPEGFDEDTDSWTIEGGNWGFDTVYFPQGTGEHTVAATVPTADFARSRQSRLVSPPFNVPNAEDNPRIKLSHWFDLPLGSGAIVQIRSFGTDWVSVRPPDEWFSGQSVIWSDWIHSLSAFAGNVDTQLGFLLSAGESPGPGWFIEKLEIITGPPPRLSFPEHFDEPKTGWFPTNGVWEIHNGVMGTVRNGVYPRGTDSAMVSPWFRLPSTPPRTLRMSHNYELVAQDTVELSVRAVGGPWQVLESWKGRSAVTSTWEHSLNDLEGKELQFRFGINSANGPGSGFGWQIEELELVEGNPTLMFPETFDNTKNNWWTTAGVWENGQSATGESVAATVLESPYPIGANSRLTSPKFVVPSGPQNPRLRLVHSYAFPHGDSGTIEVQLPDGTWTVIKHDNGEFIGRSGTWTTWQVDLTPYANQTIRLGFRIESNPNNQTQGQGWSLDQLDLLTGLSKLTLPESFETPQEWHTTGGIWQIGTPLPGNLQAKSGSVMAGTLLHAAYPAGMDSTLTSPSVIVPPAGAEPNLTFWSWHAFGTGGSGTIVIHRPDGTTEALQTLTGESRAWTRYTIPLSDYAGERVELGFRAADPTTTGPGWYIDDIDIATGRRTIPNPEGFESEVSNWTTEGGTWEFGPSSTPIPNTGHRLAGTILNGNYGSNVDARIISPPFRVPESDLFPSIQFWQWRELGAGDTASVEVLVNSEPFADPLNRFQGTSNNRWVNGFLPLTPYAGQTIQLAFRLQSDGSSHGRGWYIDDVTLQSNVFPLQLNPQFFGPDINIDEGSSVLENILTPLEPYRFNVRLIEAAWLPPFEDLVSIPPVTDPATVTLGLLTWATTERHGPAQYRFQLEAHDPESQWNPIDVHPFTVVVNEVNEAPTLSSIPDQPFIAGRPFQFQIRATDTDIPENTLIFSSVSLPEGALIDSASGLINWTPNSDQSGNSHEIEIRVTDTGEPALSVTERFLLVPGGDRPSPIEIELRGGRITVTQPGISPNTMRQLLSSQDLALPTTQWQTIATLTSAGPSYSFEVAENSPSRYFMVIDREIP